jgi:disulfide bond formation protein DsbB
MLKVCGDRAVQKAYWSVLIVLALGLELAALYYQYVLDELPCVVCIQVRLWLMALLAVSIVALLIKKSTLIVALMHAMVSVIMLAMLDRSWLLLGIERGTIFGSCDMDLGLPGWLAVEQWAPFIFAVKTACGYTPELFLGITMAEALLVFSAALLLLSLIMLSSVLFSYKK